MTGKVLLVFVLAATATPAAALAQGTGGFERGARVRVLAPEFSRQRPVGRLGTIDSAGVHLVRGRADTVLIPRNAVMALDVSAGRRSHWVRGVAIGGLSGLAVATAVWIADEAGEEQDPFSDALDQVFFPAVATVLGGGGAIIGGVIGALARTEQWDRVPASEIRWGVGPVAGGGVRAAVSLRF